MSARRVFIRADASAQIGTGHIMRCLVLANQLKAHGAHINFICRCMPEALSAMVEADGHQVLRLPETSDGGVNDGPPTHRHWLPVSWQTDARQTLALLTRMGGADWMIADHYALDARWERMIRQQTGRLLVIDDLADRPHDCDLLLDQTLGRQRADYQSHVPDHALTLLGPQYALVRRQFALRRDEALTRRRSSPAVGNILISFGGNDPLGLTARTLKALAATQPHVSIDAALGLASPQALGLTDIARDMAQSVTFHDFSSSMAELMQRADLAIGGAGTSSWERCCLGLPSLMVILAENQRKGAVALQEAGAAGIVDAEADNFSRSLQQHLQDLAGHPARLQAMAQAAASINHGFGADLTALHMLPPKARGGTNITLAPMELSHMGLVFDWQNEPDMRTHSRNPHPPSMEEHQHWTNEILSDPDRIVWIIEADGQSAGLLRLDRLEDGEYEVSILVSGAHRGRGIALTALRLLNSMAAHLELIAIVHVNNPASRRLFEKAGYCLHQTSGDLPGFMTLKCPARPNAGDSP